MLGNRVAVCVGVAAVVLSASTAAWAEVQLRGREGHGGIQNRLTRSKSRQASRSHLILDFPAPPTAETVRMLSDRGLRVVAYLPLTGVLVGAVGSVDPSGLGLAGFDVLQPEDKLSAELAGESGAYLVEFHGDVPLEDRLAPVTEAGLEVREHRDLLPGHLLVRGTLEQARSLAEWDEVAYIFPASRDLVEGLPLVGCEGGATEAGLVGQLTQRVGEGWDGPGLNRADLTYSFQVLTNKAPADEVEQEIRRAMSVWSQAVKVSFQRGYSTNATRNINILFGSRDHGDPYPFDGPGQVLAHTFYPAPPNPEPIAGDLHFDDEESWRIGGDIDIFSVALHELGHALGLGHSDAPGAVMYPYYRRVSALSAEDIGAIRMMYEAAEEAVDGPLELTVTSPANQISTTAAVISVTGDVSGAAGTPVVNWRANGGETGSGILSYEGPGHYVWQAAAVPVQMGGNEITMTVTDAQSRTASRVLQVKRVEVPEPPPPPIPPPPPAPPLSLEVTAPAANATVTANVVVAAGTVAGGSGRATVRWASDRGASGAAVVTSSVDGAFRWEVASLPLQAGANLITITATDPTGATSAKAIRVSYNPPVIENPNSGEKPPVVAIVSPNTSFLMTSMYSVALRGTAKDPDGVAQVQWECSCGSSGVAQGTTSWTIPNIGLALGSHKIKVTARDSKGNLGSATMTVFRYEP